MSAVEPKVAVRSVGQAMWKEGLVAECYLVPSWRSDPSGNLGAKTVTAVPGTLNNLWSFKNLISGSSCHKNVSMPNLEAYVEKRMWFQLS